MDPCILKKYYKIKLYKMKKKIKLSIIIKINILKEN